jgi:hypothetical protein
MDPWKSWGLVVVVSVGAYCYYAQQKKDKRKSGKASVVTEPVQSFRKKVEGKNKRKKEGLASQSDQGASDGVDAPQVAVTSSGAEQVKQRKGGKKNASSQGKSSAVDMNTSIPQSGEDSREDGVDNKEFARQLANVQAGTSFKSSEKATRPTKTVKQSKVNGKSLEVGASEVKDQSGNSSTTGADADDDLSSTNSPTFGATIRGAEGVSDMLEAPAPGPSVLRLTEPKVPQRPSAPKPSKSTQEQETKKQRQRKAANEARKAEREEAERQRRVLMEKQMRTAREARGEPAKNGVPVAPSSNAWSRANNTIGGGVSSSDSTPGKVLPLLDTFESSTAGESGNSAKHTQTGVDTKSKLADLNWPSEEDQMRMLDEMEGSGSWQMVNGKKRKKVDSAIGESPKTGDTTSGDVGNSSTQSESAAKDVTGKEEKSASSGKEKKEKYLPYEHTPHPDNSDWAVV